MKHTDLRKTPTGKGKARETPIRSWIRGHKKILLAGTAYLLVVAGLIGSTVLVMRPRKADTEEIAVEEEEVIVQDNAVSGNAEGAQKNR